MAGTIERNLASVADLRTLLRLPSLDDSDPYALMMISQASEYLRDEADEPGWVRWDGSEPRPETPGVEGLSWAPQGALDIALWVAERAYTDPRNRSRRTSGPISESYFENGIYGLELKDGERRRLSKLTGTTSSGLWSQPITAGQARPRMIAPPVVGPHGATWPGSRGFHIADEGDFPYNLEPAP